VRACNQIAGTDNPVCIRMGELVSHFYVAPMTAKNREFFSKKERKKSH
jgi:hypothetical protein